MSDRFKVSVIVPVYNTAKYLPECLDSLVRQTIGLDFIQIVVVDDGSTDDSTAVIESYAERYPDNFVCLKQVNAGQGAARNLGISSCEGEYVGFMDSDDFADPDMYRLLYDAASAADADMCVCGMVSFCDRNEAREYSHNPQLPANPMTQESLFVTPQVQPYIRIVRRAMLLDNDVRFPETRGNEDNGFHFKLAPFCSAVTTVSSPLVKRRLRSGSTVASVTPFFCEQFFDVIDDTLEFYREHGLTENYGELLEAGLVRMLLCSRLGSVGMIKDPSERKVLMDKTMSCIASYFPDRKDNRYLNGPLGLYLKHADRRVIAMTQAYFAGRYRRHFNVRI